MMNLILFALVISSFVDSSDILKKSKICQNHYDEVNLEMLLFESEQNYLTNLMKITYSNAKKNETSSIISCIESMSIKTDLNYYPFHRIEIKCIPNTINETIKNETQCKTLFTQKVLLKKMKCKTNGYFRWKPFIRNVPIGCQYLF